MFCTLCGFESYATLELKMPEIGVLFEPTQHSISSLVIDNHNINAAVLEIFTNIELKNLDTSKDLSKIEIEMINTFELL